MCKRAERPRPRPEDIPAPRPRVTGGTCGHGALIERVRAPHAPALCRVCVVVRRLVVLVNDSMPDPVPPQKIAMLGDFHTMPFSVPAGTS